MAAIAFVFTIARVAEMLGEDEVWLQDLSISMFPEDGCLSVLDVGEHELTVFTEHGIEHIQQIITDQRAEGKAPLPKRKS